MSDPPFGVVRAGISRSLLTGRRLFSGPARDEAWSPSLACLRFFLDATVEGSSVGALVEERIGEYAREDSSLAGRFLPRVY